MTLTGKGLTPLTRTDISILAGEYLESNYATLSAAVTAIGATVGTLRISTPNFPNGSTTTVPATLTLEFVGNGSILMDTGETVTIQSDGNRWPIRKIFNNALASQGTISFTDNFLLQDAYSEWWGADGIGVADASPAINAAIQAVPSRSQITIRLPGTYLLNSTLSVLYQGAAGSSQKYGMTFEGGPGKGIVSHSGGGILIWNGNSTDFLFKVWSRDNTFNGLYIKVATGKTLLAAFDMDRASGSISNSPDAPACTNNQWDNVTIIGDDGTATNGTITDGWVVGRSGDPNNNEFFNLNNCLAQHFLNAAYNVMQFDFQSKQHTFNECNFGYAPYLIWFKTGSFIFDSGNFHGATTAAIRSNPSQATTVMNSSGETNVRLWISDSGSSPNGGAITLINNRFSLDALHADGQFINASWGNPWTLIGNTLTDGVENTSFGLNIASPSPGTILNSKGNNYANTTPFPLIKTGNSTPHSEGDIASTSTGLAEIIQPKLVTCRPLAANTTLTPTDEVVIVNATAGNITINLPISPFPPRGKVYTIKKADTSANTVSVIGGTGTNGIDFSGDSGAVVIPGGSRGYLTVVYEPSSTLGQSWFILSKSF
jgi:hypothetical protein